MPAKSNIGSVEIGPDCIDTYYYAVAHRPVLRSLTITNVDLAPVAGDLVVRISIDGGTQQPLLHDKTFEIPALQMRDAKTFRAIRVAPNHRELALLDEQLTADLTVTVTVGANVVGTARQPITFLAYNQWMHRPEFLDSFSSFVLPNHPAIAPAMDRARMLLGERTGMAATEGYQSGDPARVREIARAVFDALAQERLAYTSPPASFEGFGQKIRTPDVVFLERCATCLDSSVLYASCLAAAGLDPVLVLSTGHAFAGYWTNAAGLTTESRDLMARPVLDNRNDIAALFAAGALTTVETTFITVSSTARTFDEAATANAAMFNDRVTELEALVNIGASRAAGVRPIPTRRIVDGVVEIEHPPAFTGNSRETPRPASEPDGADFGRTAAIARRLDAFDAPPRVRSWLNSLLDLSFANPLIDLKPGRSAFRFELPPRMLAAVEDRLLAGDAGIELLPASRVPARVLDAQDIGAALLDDFRSSGRLYSPDVSILEPSIDAAKRATIELDPTVTPARAQRAAEESVAAVMAATLESSISLLRRKAREIESQSGSNNLFLTIGAVKWTEPPTAGMRKREGMATAPLFLIPVRITGSATSAFRIKTDEGVEVTPNYCLLEKLRLTFDLVIPELETPDLDSVGIDVDATMAAVRRALGERRLNDVVVEETAHLAVLNFATFRLWKDMRDHWQQFIHNDVVRHLVERPYEAFENTAPAAKPDGSPETAELLCPIEIDESQLGAVRWAVQGRSFVIEGPPGTGKSQTITNLLAASIAANKRVLFVAEKQPALQVVKKRLEQIGLTPFCIDLHDKGSKPEQIRKQIRDSLDFAGVDRESEWQELSARLLADEQALTAYRDVVHSRNGADYSAWSACQEMVEIGDGPITEVPQSFLADASSRLPAIREALLGLPAVAGVARLPAGGPWSLCDRIDFGGVDQTALAALVGRLQANLESLSSLPPAVTRALARIEGRNEFDAVLGTVDVAVTVGLPSDPDLEVIGTPGWTASRDAALSRATAFAVSFSALLESFDRSVFTTDLGPILAAGAEAATAGLLSRGRRRRAFELLLAPVLRAAPSRSPREYVASLQQVPPARAELDAISDQLRAVPGLRLPIDWSVLDPDHLATARVRLESLPDEAQRLRTPAGALTRTAIAQGWVPDATSIATLRATRDMWSSLDSMLQMSAPSIQRWRNGRGFFEAWATSNPAWRQAAPRFLALQRWCDVLACVHPIGEAGLTTLVDGVLAGTVDLTDAYDQFRRGLVLAALDERLEVGRVDQFDGLAHDRRVQSFIARAARKRQLMRSVIPHHLVRERPFRPGSRYGEYGALERELSKTSRRLSIRKLVERYGEILPNMTPCFLMSPDSAARFLPPGAITFDLVVFDEASQIEVAEAIGAMGRANAVVVVGDSKQMPPSKFGGSGLGGGGEDDGFGGDGSGGDGDEAVFEDLESILSECVESNLPRLYLQCHYRSRHEGLIAFSNTAFYEGKLTTFPSPATDGPAPIHWRRIDGHFDRTASGDDKRTNRAEAEAIVTDILGRLDDPATSRQSICVVTLNVQQQALVYRLLEASRDDRIQALLDDDTDSGLIVRNLESVQGDERDVVLISVAFSPITRILASGAESRRLPLNFGPLNRKGGERRLNVAVTRARSEVTVFCSFEPEEMRLAENPAKGLELLKQYLSIARDGATTSGDLIARELTAPDHHRAAVAEALRGRGLRVRENVGLSKFRVDIAVGAGDRTDWQVAVLLDGPGWAARTTVYDREALPVGVLGTMGWRKVIRVWLPSWLQEPERVVDGIADAVAAVDATPPPQPPPPPPPDQIAATAVAPRLRGVTQPPIGVAAASYERVFVAASTEPVGDRDVLDRVDDPHSVQLVADTIDEILATESPIHAARLAKIVATRFGLDRVTRSRAEDILDLATNSYTRRTEFGVFLWSTDTDVDDWQYYRRTPDGVERKLEHIAAEEIANALVDIVAMSHSIERDELQKVVAEIFGFGKLTAAVRERLADVIGWTIERERLVEAGGRLRLP